MSVSVGDWVLLNRDDSGENSKSQHCVQIKSSLDGNDISGDCYDDLLFRWRTDYILC